MNGALQSPAASVEQSTGNGHVVDQPRQLLRVKDIIALGGISRDTWARWVRSGYAPSPVPNLPGHPRWKASAIAQFFDGHANRRHFFGRAR